MIIEAPSGSLNKSEARRELMCACWMLIDVHGFGIDLIGYPYPADAKAPAELFNACSSRRNRLPVQEKLLERLKQQQIDLHLQSVEDFV